MKYICFRFDVDTHKCLRDGVPNLLKLAKIYNIKFTFFINTGRAIDRLDFLHKKIQKFKTFEEIYSLTAYEKLGIKDYIYAAMVNPQIAQSYSNVIDSIYKKGHEIGLHGGKNHQNWYSSAQEWDETKIMNEISWGLTELKKINKNIVPVGFASPGWNGSNKINSVLQKKGFRYNADLHTNDKIQRVTKINNFYTIPTNMTGEPGGVGYIENCRAKKMDDNAILDDFKSKLTKRSKLAVMYDHPYYVGIQELQLLKKLIVIAIHMRYTFITMDNLLKT
jgi:peptidoglycan/xylan/chitin deacetylase (PgdA/CDA1 family)